jgi:hypothetical protein
MNFIRSSKKLSKKSAFGAMVKTNNKKLMKKELDSSAVWILFLVTSK